MIQIDVTFKSAHFVYCLTPLVTGAGAQRREPKAARFWRPLVKYRSRAPTTAGTQALALALQDGLLHKISEGPVYTAISFGDANPIV